MQVTSPKTMAGQADYGRPGQCILKVINGKNPGTIKTLTSAVTLLGEEKGCDIRLNSPQIEQLQCVIVETPQGFMVRNLYDCDKVKVNGEAVEQAVLHTGDELSVGLFSFYVEYAEAGMSAQQKLAPEDHLEEERQALRAQAAGVAAQQSALLQEELRLLQLEKALQEKEKQLGLYFQEKHLRQVQIQRTLKSRFIKLKQQETALIGTMKKQQENLLSQTDAARFAQIRYEKLRNKLKSRKKTIARRQLAILATRNTAIDESMAKLSKEYEHIVKERKSLASAQELFQSTCETENRKLKESYDQLDSEQQQRSLKATTREIDLLHREKELSAKLSLLDHNQLVLEQNEKHWNTYLTRLKLEEEGLEKRILNLREKLPDCSWPLPNTESVTNQQPIFNIPADADALMIQLEGMASHLDDQRLVLLEAWHNLEQRKIAWERQQNELLAELDVAGNELGRKQKQIEQWELSLVQKEENLYHKESQLSVQRKHIEADQATLKLQLKSYETDRNLLIHEIEVRSETMEKLGQLTHETRRELCQKSLKERDEMLREKLRLDEIRLSANSIWKDYQNRLHELESQKQSLAIAELAVGRMTLELLSGANVRVGADRRLEKIRKSIALRFKEELNLILEGKNHLQAGAVVFERQIRELGQRENELAIRSGDFAVAQTNFDEIRQQVEQDKMLNLELIKILEGRNKLLEGQIADLKSQVEKLHAVLIDETTNVKVTQAPMIRIAA